MRSDLRLGSTNYNIRHYAMHLYGLPKGGSGAILMSTITTHACFLCRCYMAAEAAAVAAASAAEDGGGGDDDDGDDDDDDEMLLHGGCILHSQRKPFLQLLLCI